MIEVGDRTGKVSLRMPSDTPIKKGLRESRRDPNGAVQVAKGALNISFSTAHGTSTVESLRKARVQLECAIIVKERGIQLPGMGTHMSAIGIGNGKLRVEFNSRGIVTDSRLQLTSSLTGNGPAEIGRGGPRVEFQSDSEVDDCSLEIPFANWHVLHKKLLRSHAESAHHTAWARNTKGEQQEPKAMSAGGAIQGEEFFLPLAKRIRGR